MLIEPQLQLLKKLKLHGMLGALERQLTDPDIGALRFEERLGLLLQHELAERDNSRLTQRLRVAVYGCHNTVTDAWLSCSVDDYDNGVSGCYDELDEILVSGERCEWWDLVCRYSPEVQPIDLSSPPMESGGGGGGGGAMPQPETPPEEPREDSCPDWLRSTQDFFGGPTGDDWESWLNDVMANYNETMDVDFDIGISSVNPSTPAAWLLGGAVTREYGGVTPLQAVIQAVQAAREKLRIPGLIGIRTPAVLAGTAAASALRNYLALKGAYSFGVLVGSMVRATADHAIEAVCSP
jgi:hypothetical protein